MEGKEEIVLERESFGFVEEEEDDDDEEEEEEETLNEVGREEDVFKGTG